MRSNGTLYFMFGDHLDSTSLVTFANGNKVSETRYTAWGEVRYASGNTPTDYTFTGQRSHTSEFGLMFYNARWYDPYLNQFTQPDSIIPDPYNPQDWNRYSYVRNNPQKYIDPTGHNLECGPDGVFCHEGYSNWERRTLRKLFEEGGPNAVHGVLYILDHNIHITVGTGWQSTGGETGAWFDEGSNSLIINSESSGNFDSSGNLSLWGLSLVIHEAKHLEQGSNLSHSRLGEMEAWQIQIDVLTYLGHFPDPNRLPDWALDIKNATTVEAFASAVEFHKPGYWNRYGDRHFVLVCVPTLHRQTFVSFIIKDRVCMRLHPRALGGCSLIFYHKITLFRIVL